MDSSLVKLKETTYHNIDTTKFYDAVKDKIFDDKYYDPCVENKFIYGSLESLGQLFLLKKSLH